MARQLGFHELTYMISQEPEYFVTAHLHCQFRVTFNYSNVREGKRHFEIDFVLNPHVDLLLHKRLQEIDFLLFLNLLQRTTAV